MANPVCCSRLIPWLSTLNNGSGVLSKTGYAVGGAVTLGDFNGDGRQDIAVSNASGVQVLLNVGSGISSRACFAFRCRSPLRFLYGNEQY